MSQAVSHQLPYPGETVQGGGEGFFFLGEVDADISVLWFVEETGPGDRADADLLRQRLAESEIVPVPEFAHVDHHVVRPLGHIVDEADVAAVTFAYAANRRHVFQSQNRNILKEAFAFYCSRVGTLAVEMILMLVLVSILKMNDKAAKFITQFFVMALNYIVSKFLVFRTN